MAVYKVLRTLRSLGGVIFSGSCVAPELLRSNLAAHHAAAWLTQTADAWQLVEEESSRAQAGKRGGREEMVGRACLLLGLLLVPDALAMVIQRPYGVAQRDISHAPAGGGSHVYLIGQGLGIAFSPPTIRVGVNGDGECVVQPLTSSRNRMPCIIGSGGLPAPTVDYQESGTFQCVPLFADNPYRKSAHNDHADCWHVGGFNHGCSPRLLRPSAAGGLALLLTVSGLSDVSSEMGIEILSSSGALIATCSVVESSTVIGTVTYSTTAAAAPLTAAESLCTVRVSVSRGGVTMYSAAGSLCTVRVSVSRGGVTMYSAAGSLCTVRVSVSRGGVTMYSASLANSYMMLCQAQPPCVQSLSHTQVATEGQQLKISVVQNSAAFANSSAALLLGGVVCPLRHVNTISVCCDALPHEDRSVAPSHPVASETISSHPISSHPIPPHPIPSHPIPSHLFLPHPLSHPVASYPIRSHLIQFHHIPSDPLPACTSPPIPSRPDPSPFGFEYGTCALAVFLIWQVRTRLTPNMAGLSPSVPNAAGMRRWLRT